MDPGKSRLYVHRFGECFGYVNLINRSSHVESSHERARPNLESVLEWFADVDAEPKQVGRLGRLAMWVAGGAPRRAVAVRFRRRNIDRLYVHLADGTRRTQIGYCDLLKNQVHAAEPEFAAIVTKAAAVRAAEPPRSSGSMSRTLRPGSISRVRRLGIRRWSSCARSRRGVNHLNLVTPS